jgi:hypothetical protein
METYLSQPVNLFSRHWTIVKGGHYFNAMDEKVCTFDLWLFVGAAGLKGILSKIKIMLILYSDLIMHCRRIFIPTKYIYKLLTEVFWKVYGTNMSMFVYVPK